MLEKSFKIAVFICLLVLGDQILGFVLHKLFLNQTTGQNQSLNYVFKSCKANIVIFGNSRAQHHYDTRIISDSLKMSCYNAGQDGGHSLLLPYAQIEVLLKRYTPKIIIIEFDPNSLMYYQSGYDKLAILLPYYYEFDEIKPLVLLRSPYEKIKLFSAIYPFNSNIVNIIRFNTNSHAARKQDFEGYVPIKDKVMNITMSKNEPKIESSLLIDSTMVKALKSIILKCKEKNVNLYFINSPIFHSFTEKQDSTSSSAKLALEIIFREKIKYFDFSKNSLFTGKLEWFADKNHLNDKGADIFTKMVVEKISH